MNVSGAVKKLEGHAGLALFEHFKKFLMDEETTLIEEITHFSTQPGTRSRSAAEGSAGGDRNGDSVRKA